MPAKDGVGRDNRANLGEGLETHRLAKHCEPASLVIVESDSPFPGLIAQDSILFLEVIDNTLLVIVEYAGDEDAEELPGIESWTHVRAYRPAAR